MLMLKIENLHVTIEEKEVLKGIDMEFDLGKNYCLLGKNGSGKSSLALTIMGHPKYEITEGNIRVDGESLKEMAPHERAQK